MELRKLQELAKTIAKILNTEIVEVNEEEVESDAGFELADGHNFQYSPYLPEPFCFSYYCGKTGSLGPLGSYKTAEELIEAVSKL